MAGKQIVIVGGGAGGLVLATKLGNRLGRAGLAEIVLVDANLTHVWKPLLHEIAAGTLIPAEDAVFYLGHARSHGFRFVQGEMARLGRGAKEVVLAPVPGIDGHGVVPERRVGYDTLVLALGSVSNDFGVPGVQEHCVFLDGQRQAENLQQRILYDCLQAQAVAGHGERQPLRIAIIGAGATGVELAAELHRSTRQLVSYGLDRIDPDRDVELTLIEAAPRVLPALPEKLAAATDAELRRLGVTILVAEQVSTVTATGIHTRQGRFIEADLKIWCAGIRTPAPIRGLDDLELDRLGRVVVDTELRTTRDPAIYAIGDCAASIPVGGDRPVPPRAQAAYQQALVLARSLERQQKGLPALPFVYKDYGSLVSLGYGAAGSLMGNLLGTVNIEGRIARAAYVSLYRKHQLALHGWVWLVLTMLSRFIARGTHPRLKLH
ncbi:MAG TPA: NAD(P)/FAD-dependent oxidoreductase [Geminicoccaceae bacterium]|nr:NAD(P)/FAD-dependent oxidoreductase [Geminicoccus sp.]HMU51028.1 NAD(P)/FAD-dependent oxidoreductase [Geminicoccaceae bacterium]